MNVADILICITFAALATGFYATAISEERRRDAAENAVAEFMAVFRACGDDCPCTVSRHGQVIPCDIHDPRLWERLEEQMR